LFSTANFAMLRCPVRQILLVRNALYFSKMYQQMFLGKHGLRYRLAFALRRWLILRSVRSADVVMTPTQAMFDSLAQFVKLDRRKALVDYYGAGQQHAASQRFGAPSAAVQSGVTRLTYVSLYSEHKNLSTLLRAMPLLNGNGTTKFVLRTTADPAREGAAWTVTHKDDLALARQPNVAPWVEFLGPLRAEQVEELYRQGDVFVFPSLCESFGHPMVEAMVHGLPIVAADTPVNREICGRGAVYFNPLDPSDLAEQVCRVACNVDLRWRLLAEAEQRVRSQFTWAAHVQRILEVSQSSLAHSG
jgi:glycosyltransferase involved in cell wall biosynthesis